MILDGRCAELFGEVARTADGEWRAASGLHQSVTSMVRRGGNLVAGHRASRSGRRCARIPIMDEDWRSDRIGSALRGENPTVLRRLDTDSR